MVGAWSLSGIPVAQLLDAADWARMQARVGLRDQVRTDRLFLCADALLEDPPACVGAAGFVAGGGLQLALEEDAFPEGHYVLARRHGASLALTRSCSGGERLYFIQVGTLVLFASSVRALLAHSRVERRLNPAVLDESLLTGLTMFGQQTLHAGIDEVLPGHTLSLGDTVERQRWRDADALSSPCGDPETLARAFRDQLTEAVVLGAGSARPVVVALSGGIDSSAVAAAAVDAFGADNVEAITYEFDDPGHSTELHYATLVAKRLGIRRHHVFQLSADAYFEAIPEAIWRAESLVHWPKAFMLLVAREVAARGHDRYLTGFGIGSHMTWLAELGDALEGRSPALLRHWKPARFGGRIWPDTLRRLHPSLEPPHPRLYYMVVRMLHRAGYIRDPLSFFPAGLSPLLGGLLDGPATDSDLPLGRQLQLQAFSHLVSCIDVTRSEKASRELGVYRVSPAHFRRCIPYAYFPLLPRPRLYTDARNLRPGKHLLRLAYRGTLPDEVLFRVKSWGDAVASDTWLRRGRQLMLSALPMFPADTARHGPGYREALARWEPRSVLATGLALRLWERIFVELPDTDEPPTWSSLQRSLGQHAA